MNHTKLIILRGPSGSGKSTVARKIRDEQLALGTKIAYVEQDYFRRIVLKEKDVPQGFNIQLIKNTTIFLLNEGYSVIMEGIFDKERYEEMFKELVRHHPSHNFFFYFDIPLEETLKRHESKHNRHEFGEKEMRQWYKEKDYLDFVKEAIIPEESNFEETVALIQRASGFIVFPVEDLHVIE